MDRSEMTGTERFRDRLATSSRIWREQLPVLPLVYSTDGRTFAYNAPLTSVVVVGEYVRITTQDGRVHQGHAMSKEVGMLMDPSIQAGSRMSDVPYDDSGDASEMSFQSNEGKRPLK